jgi:hypothetical protein
MIRSAFVFILLIPFWRSAQALDFRLQGQASVWALGSHDPSFQTQAGLRYVPGITIGLPGSGDWKLDAELSGNGYVSGEFRTGDTLRTNARVKPYRGWIRAGTPRFESRLGLQKISFGSATLLRPLMWFDRIDPRDPLQTTDGVYALLLRYYFPNNANAWLWGLAGNTETKGWETLPSEQWSPEMGGRVQLPVPRGEVAVSCHHRRADVSGLVHIPEFVPEPAENRVGLDGKWDVGAGLWFEALLNHAANALPLFPWQRWASLGADYTFGIGNGLGVMAEHMVVDYAAEVLKAGERTQLSALSLSYPLGLLDNLRGIVFYDWQSRGLYRYLSWQRTLDNWLFSAALFWNPDRSQGMSGPAGSSAAAGKGIQLMVVFNH